MENGTLLVLAYVLAWVGLLAYLGWIALRVRGVQADVEAVRELIEQRERAGETPEAR